MSNISTPELVVLVAAIASAVVSIINAIGQFWGRKAGRERAESNHQEIAEKITDVKELANGNLARVAKELAAAREQIAALEKMVKKEPGPPVERV